MVDVALLVGGVLMIFAIVPLASGLAKRAASVRARLAASRPGELPFESKPDLVVDLAAAVACGATVLEVHDDEAGQAGDVRATLMVEGS